jgi:hypothetical protein
LPRLPGTKAMPARTACRVTRSVSAVVPDVHRAAADAARPEQRGEQLRLALPGEPAEPEHLPLVHLEGHPVEPVGDEVGDLSSSGRVVVSSAIVSPGHLGGPDLGADHQLDDLLLGGGGEVDDAGDLAVAQHRGTVADVKISPIRWEVNTTSTPASRSSRTTSNSTSTWAL